MTDISITKEEFFNLFPDKMAERVWFLLTTTPRDADDLIKNYLPSKLWRLNNLYKIIDKHGNPATFKMNRAQFVVYSKVYLHHRIIILKSRQQGISTLWLISFMDDALFLSNLNCGLMAQGKDEARTLLERVKYTWDNLNPAVKMFLARKLTKDNSSEFSFNNGSTLFIRTSFRSATLHRLHISELGKIANKSPEKAKETNTGTLQALAPPNIGVIESTAEGNNMFKQKWDRAEQQLAAGRLAGKDFYPVFLSWLFDPDCVEFEDQLESADQRDYFARMEKETGLTITKHQRNFWIAQERELEGDIYQEYPATPREAFAAAKDGTYWARMYIERVLQLDHKVEDLYDPHLKVYGVLDFGRRDYFVLTFFQFFQESSDEYTIRIIHEYYNSGEDLEHYADYITNIVEERDWDFEEFALPHDAMVVELSAKGMTRQDKLAEYGVDKTIVLDKEDVATGIQLVRAEMKHIWIDARCTYLEDCFLKYTKVWDNDLGVWKQEPKHDEYSHGADTIRYMIKYVVEYLVGMQTRRSGKGHGRNHAN